MATRALSADAIGASSEFTDRDTDTSRRQLFGFAAAGAIAIIAQDAAFASPSWTAGDWIARWHRLGCGLEVGGNALHVKGRLNGDRRAIGAMMAEIASPQRQSAVIERIERADALWLPPEDPAMRVVREMERIDAEFVSEEDDPVANAAWLERWDRTFDRLPRARATTGKGRAAKLRYAFEYIDTPRGDELLGQVLQYLESQA